MTPPGLSRCLKQGAAVAASFAMVGLVVAGPQMGQAASDPHPTIEELLRRLEERDALIADLQRRVGELERQIAPTAGRVPPVASSAEQESSTQAEEAPAVESGAAQAVPGQFEVDRRRPSARWSGRWW
jgi:hypothetical protein